MVAFRIVMILYIGILAFLIGGFICSKLFKKRLQKCPYITWLRYRMDIRILSTVLLVVTVLCIFILGSIYTGTAAPSIPDHLLDSASQGDTLDSTSENSSQSQSSVSATEEQQIGFLDHIAGGVSKILNILDGDFTGFVGPFTEHIWFPTFLCFILPILTISALILTILDFFPLWFKNREEYLIFSDTDDRSLLLAKDMMKKISEEDNDSSWKLRRDRKVIFLHTDKSKLSAEEREKINQVRGRVYPYSEVDLLRIHRSLRKRTLRFFFLSKDSDESFSRLKELIDGVAHFHLFQTPKRKVKALEAQEARGIYKQEIYFLSESDSSPLLVDHLRSKMSKDKARKPIFAHTEIHLLDRYRLVTYDLLRTHPLYDHSTKNKIINILIIGFGKVGQSFYKTATAFSYIKNHTVSYTLVDHKVEEHWKKLLAQAPEIYEIPGSQRIPLNAESKDLTDALEEKFKDKEFTYIMVSLGDDDRNIRVARNLVRHYRKAYWQKTLSTMPAIFVNLENEIKSDYVTEIFQTDKDPEALKGLSPVVIGGDHNTFSEALLLNRKLWEMAVKLHRGMNPQTPDSFMTEYERRSSVAAVSYAMYHSKSPSPGIADEHERWIRYSRSEGMQKVNKACAKNMIAALKTHRDVIAGLSPCLVSTEELGSTYTDLSAKYDAEGLVPPDNFTDKDKYVVTNANILTEYWNGTRAELKLPYLKQSTQTQSTKRRS